MRVAIGAVAGTTGGPATYAVELVRALVAEFPSDEWTVITDRPDLFETASDVIAVPLGSAWGQPWWDHVRAGRWLRRGSFDLYHGTKGVLPWCLPVPGVATIHDLAVLHMPETFHRAQRLHLRLETPHTVRRAAAIITVSRSSATDLVRAYPRAADKIEVVPEAASPELAPASDEEIAAWRERYGATDPAVGYLGTIQPRKNVDLAAEAFVRAAGDRPWQFLLAGRMRPGYRPACLGWGDERIRYLGEIPAEDLPAFFGALACMVSPSAYEGFGLTFLEAMAAGCPVIGIANSSVPEVVGDAGILVRSADAAELADAIDQVVTDAALAADLSRRGV
ncbi:MAG: glycosyltransferase family 1 protein, partial [Deltaproteobacteria bacterium]